jgi:hypothetical protein
MSRANARIFFLVAGLAGCSRDTVTDAEADAQRFAKAVCKAAETCGCAPSVASGSACIDRYSDLFLRAFDLGLKVEDECFGTFLSALARDPCLIDPAWATSMHDCFAMRGTQDRGESCSTHPELASMRVNECRDGLNCRNGACGTDSLDSLESGDPCIPQPPNQACGLGLYCDLGGECQVYANAGEPCDSAWACRPGSYCPGAAPGSPSTCQPSLELGDGCDLSEFRQCGIEADDGAATPRWCDPQTGSCEIGQSFLCDALNDPVTW